MNVTIIAEPDAGVARTSQSASSAPPRRRPPRTANAADLGGDRSARRLSQVLLTALPRLKLLACDDDKITAQITVTSLGSVGPVTQGED